MHDLIILLLACAGVHRIWNFEAIFTPARTWLLPRLQKPGIGRYFLNPVLCHTCNIWWICLLLICLHMFVGGPIVAAFLTTAAAYVPVRAVLWLYMYGAPALPKLLGIAAVVAPPPAPVAPALRKAADFKPFSPPTIDSGTPPTAAPTSEAAPCPTCEEKKAALLVKQGAVLSYRRRIVLMTSLANFDPSYSLSTAIIDQARMLASNTAVLVQIWVHIGADLSKAPKFPANVEILPIIPAVIWRDDRIDPPVVDQLVSVIRQNLIKLGNATVITHDLLFQASYATLTAAIWQLSKLPGFAWLHCCHSAAATVRPSGGDAVRNRTTLPYGHRLLCLNDADRPYLAAYYNTDPANVLVCPNARDVTTFGTFDERAERIVRAYGLHLADVVQIYPVSATRLSWKGVDKIIEVFGHLTKLGLSCRLVLATAHANGEAERAALTACRDRAIAMGLPSEHLAITSEIFPELASVGVSQATIKDLFSVSNLFVFPTQSEACSLVMAEAAISGCLLVANSSLHTTASYICPERSLSFPFGSLRKPTDLAPINRLAEKIRETLLACAMNCTRRTALRQFSYEMVGGQLRDAIERTPFVSANAP
jgi:glycosyltransferase involved in cell wall biosynthesis